MILKERIVQKLQDLPDADIREALNFVDFLTWRNTQQDEPLLSVAGVLSGETLSADEIEHVIYSDVGAIERA